MRLGVCAPITTAPLAGYLTSGTDGLPPGLGGTPVTALIRAALDRGWQVIVFSLDPSLAREHIATGPALTLHTGPFRPRHRARDLFGAERRWLAQAIAAEAPALVHAHWTYEFALGAIESGLPTVVTAHDRPLRILRWDHTPYRLIRTLMAGMVVHRARCLTAVSISVAEHFRRFFGWKRPMPVIPNALEPEWFEPAAGAGSDLVFVSALTGWGPMKNTRGVLDAFARVRRQQPEARLLLFGDGHGAGQAAERWARRSGLASGVDFAGQVSRQQFRNRLRTATALVHPSREESYSMVVAEAMASGVPVIAAAGSGGLADTLEHERHLLAAEADSPASLADAMLRLARSASLRERLAHEAREMAQARFSLPAVLDAYAAVYRQLEAA